MRPAHVCPAAMSRSYRVLVVLVLSVLLSEMVLVPPSMLLQ